MILFFRVLFYFAVCLSVLPPVNAAGPIINPYRFTAAGGGTITFGAGAANGVDSGALAVNLTGVSIGDGIVVGVGWEGGGESYTTIADSGGAGSNSTWTALAENKHDTGSEPAMRMFYTLSSTRSGTVTYTATPSGTPTFSRIFVARITPAGGTLVLDTTDVDNEGSGSGSLATGAITTTGASGATIAFGFFKGFTGINFTSPLIGGSAATLVTTAQSDTVMWYRVAQLSSGTAAITVDASDRWVSGIASWKIGP